MSIKKLMTMMLLLLVLTGGAWGAWQWSARETPYAIVNATGTGTAIVAFGDSLTEGVGASPGKSYPEQLSKRLGVPVLNKGVRGNTAGEALSRIGRDVLERDPRIVLLLLGGNDLLRRVPREETLQAYESIITQAQAKGALVVVLVLEVGAGSELAKSVREIARRKGCPMVRDILGGVMGHDDLMSDMIHPNDSGYAIMAQKIEPVVRAYLK